MAMSGNHAASEEGSSAIRRGPTGDDQLPSMHTKLMKRCVGPSLQEQKQMEKVEPGAQMWAPLPPLPGTQMGAPPPPLPATQEQKKVKRVEPDFGDDSECQNDLFPSDTACYLGDLIVIVCDHESSPGPGIRTPSDPTGIVLPTLTSFDDTAVPPNQTDTDKTTIPPSQTGTDKTTAPADEIDVNYLAWLDETDKGTAAPPSQADVGTATCTTLSDEIDTGNTIAPSQVTSSSSGRKKDGLSLAPISATDMILKLAMSILVILITTGKASFKIIIFGIILFGLIGTSGGDPDMGMELSPSCQKHIKDTYGFNCPVVTLQDILDIQQYCCREHPGTTYHCQADEANERKVSGCYVDKILFPGYRRVLYKTQTGQLRMKIEPCSDDTFEPSPHNSSELTYPYCPKHTKCRSNEEVLYPGNTTTDVTCRCKEGYRPEPFADKCVSFTQHSECHCVPLDCGNAQEPAPLPDPPHSGKVKDIYKCRVADTYTQHSSTTTSSATTQKPASPHTTATPPAESHSTKHIGPILGTIVSVVVMAVLIAFYCCLKRTRP